MISPKTIIDHFVHPGDMIVLSKPATVWTILGSCVSVILFDPVKGQVGLNHYQYPQWSGKGVPTPSYGSVAIPRLIKKMILRGSEIEDIEARVVGGAIKINKTFGIGKKNIEIAFKELRKFNIKVVGSRTGGMHGRKVKFSTERGQLFVEALGRAKDANILSN